jgi:hypothetical protein
MTRLATERVLSTCIVHMSVASRTLAVENRPCNCSESRSKREEVLPSESHLDG